ncbi:hypothetical protein [Lewinella sp. W8]|uniref:hypothetical protein n=1 Tax=Lewinella sp. W8 TaxID=2528208 RepID=UPI0010674317|nr:hypothetical protein [Lewinella sp. W8]MTB53414.1 hypothetical protein [Lewinella sp. W8]
MSSFLQIKEEEINQFVELRQDRVRQQVETKLSTYEFIGSLFEMYLPMMADTMTAIMGSDPIDDDDEYRTIEEIDDEESDNPPLGPGAPKGPDNNDEIIR